MKKQYVENRAESLCKIIGSLFPTELRLGKLSGLKGLGETIHRG